MAARREIMLVATLIVVCIFAAPCVAAYGSPRQMYEQIMECVDSKQWDDAISLCGKYIQFNLEDVGLLRTSTLAWDPWYYSGSEPSIAEFLSGRSGNDRYALWRYMLMVALTRGEESRIDLSELYIWGPLQDTAAKRLDLALGYASEAALDVPDSPVVWYEMGRILACRSRLPSDPYGEKPRYKEAYGEAVKLFEKAIKMDERFRDAWSELIVNLLVREPARALAAVERARAVFKDDAILRLQGALASWKLKRPDDVIKWCERLTRLDSEDVNDKARIARAYSYMGMVYADSKDSVMARAGFSKSSRMYKDVNIKSIREDGHWRYWQIPIESYASFIPDSERSCR